MSPAPTNGAPTPATQTLAAARARDASDPLRFLRARFALPTAANGEPVLYLCGHSLGLMPLDARRFVEQELDDWARLGVLGHEEALRPWIAYHENLTAPLAALCGALPEEVVAMNSLTVNLHLMLASFYRPSGRRTKILIEAGAFSSDRHAVTSQLSWHGADPQTNLIELAPASGSQCIDADAIDACLERHGPEIALVLWPGVQFRTGQAFDLVRIVQAAHAAGCVAGLDLAHSIGNVPLALHACEADFAVWCSYKYLNGGPGAIGGCFVHQRHVRGAPAARLQGWWGHEQQTRFRMEPLFRAAAGAAAWQISNPPILAAAPLLAALSVFEEATMQRLRAKSIELTGFLETLLRPLAPALELITPVDPDARGSQLSVRVSGGRGREVLQRLLQRGVICDWRDPDLIRMAPVPLYNRFEDVFQAAGRLAQALAETA
ncbi:MAG TPA: kynureninase [Steroidobacteraceae bacterium]